MDYTTSDFEERHRDDHEPQDTGSPDRGQQYQEKGCVMSESLINAIKEAMGPEQTEGSGWLRDEYSWGYNACRESVLDAIEEWISPKA